MTQAFHPSVFSLGFDQPPRLADRYFHISQELLCVLGWDGHIRCANPAWIRVMGDPRPGSPRSSLLEVTHPEDSPILAELLEQLQSDAGAFVFEGRFSRADGSYVWLEWSVTPEPRQRLLFGSARDITGRRLVEDEMKRLSAFPRLNPQAVLEFSAAGQLTYFNDAATEMARLAGENHPSRILPNETAGVVGLCLQTGDSRLRLETQAGERTFSWSFYPIAASRVVHCYASDITEKRQLETQFLRAQRLETVGRLATGIAHDLNNILAPIMMSVNLLKEHLSDGRCETILDTLRAAVQRGADMVKQILSFTRGQPGGPSQVQLRLLLLEMARIVGETFPRSIRIHTTTPKDLWPVQADPTQMHQVLMNLCVNARDAMPDGGTLSLHAENITLTAGAPGRPADAKPGEYVLLRVTDTGTGIPPEVLPRIWEPFFTLKPAGQGTGLGLSTVLTIIKAHDGFAEVSSESGRGSCFQIFLPAARPSRATAIPIPEPPVVPGRGELLLVVDDEHAFQEITKAILQKHGYRVLTASDGREGLDVFLRHKGEIELVMTDMVMPAMGGAEFIQAVRALKPDTRVLAVSGLAENDKVTANQPGVPFLLKPFTTERLLAAIGQQIAAASQATSTE